VVVATDGPRANALLGDQVVAPASRAVRSIWFDAPQPPIPDKAIILDGAHSGPVSNAAIMTNVAPSYSTNGRALIAASVLGDALSDAEVVARATTQMHSWFGAQVDDWGVVHVNTIHHAQPAQPVGWLEPPERPVVLGERVFVCGDHRDQASIQGALASGRRCATAVGIAMQH